MQRRLNTALKKAQSQSTEAASNNQNSSKQRKVRSKGKIKEITDANLIHFEYQDYNVGEQRPSKVFVPKNPRTGLNGVPLFDFTNFNVDKIITILLTIGSTKDPLPLIIPLNDLLLLCYYVRGIFLNQGTLLKLKPGIVIVGDLHANYSSLIHIFNHVGIPPETNFLFLGNYTGHGQNNLETLCLLLALKVKYPLNVFLLRGANECLSINRLNGLYQECCRRYKSTRLWECFNDVFQMMPLCGLVGGKIFCVHGGLSSKIQKLEDITAIRRLPKPENPSLATDLIWSDFDEAVSRFEPNPRGLGCVFGDQQVKEFLQKFNLKLIVRGHQLLQNGYDFSFERKLISLFSAHSFDKHKNSAAILNVDSKLRISFTLITPTEKRNINIPVKKP